MNIIIDARMINEHLHGIARYTYELIKYLADDKSIELHILINDIEKTKKIFNGIDRINYIYVKEKFLSLGEQLRLPLILNKFNKSNTLFHSPSFVSSPLIKLKTAMTIHDLNHLRFPQFYSKFHKYYYEFIVKPSANKAEIIFTDSEFSKKEILEWLQCDERKVVVTYCGVDSGFSDEIGEEQLHFVRSKYNLPEDYILYVGNLKPHKNVSNLLKAMSVVKSKTTLLINGKPNEELGNIIEKCNLNDRVKFIGYIDDADLAPLYKMAKIFIFPSLYEGFGLPPLEAMASGCAVITSNKSSLPEVVGDAAITVDPNDYNEIGKAIDLLLGDENLRNELISKGYERSKIFTWEKTNDVIRDVYMMILKN